jgi:hypothetical protein
LPLIKQRWNGVVDSGDFDEEYPLLLEKVVTLESEVCRVRKREKK